MNTIDIKSQSGNYKVIISDSLTTLIKNYFESDKKYFVIIDEKLFSSYFPVLVEQIPNSIIYPLKGGEDAKTLKTYSKIVELMLENNFSKTDTMVAFGGGTIGDLAGYIASTYKRGMKYINVPTTTLAMIDSSIGGKNGLNFGDIKNAIGEYKSPEYVLIGLDVLNSLDERNYNNGLFESIKIAMISDKELFELFKQNPQQNIEEIIVKSIKTKARIVEIDEYDTNERKVLNYGHTIGHAMELTSPDLLHGEAVANGILMMSKTKSFRNDVSEMFRKLNLKRIEISDIDMIISLIENDKKVENNSIKIIDVDEIGTSIIKTINLSQLKGVIENYVK